MILKNMKELNEDNQYYNIEVSNHIWYKNATIITSYLKKNIADNRRFLLVAIQNTLR